MKRYEITCNDCNEDLGSTNDPREAYDIGKNASDNGHGTGVDVTARGLANLLMFSRANKDR